MYPKSLDKLIACFKELPGIGSKTAERLTFALLEFDDDKINKFIQSLSEIKHIKKCTICNNYSDRDVCEICADTNRSDDILFVVEKAKDIILFEKMNIFHGKYHVLGGVISPINGIYPDDIDIVGLVKRIEKYNIKEVVVVLKPTLEGDTTMQYIKKVLSNYDVCISKIPIGIPVGTDIEYLDSLTLEMAFENRKHIS